MAIAERVRGLMDDFYARNPFVRLLGMTLDQVDEGSVRLSMQIDAAAHSNAYGVAHGGALMSLADTAMGASCLTVQKKVVTLEMNINCVKAVPEREMVYALGKILHNGRQTIVAEAEIRDESGVLYAKARGSFFVIDQFDE